MATESKVSEKKLYVERTRKPGDLQECFMVVRSVSTLEALPNDTLTSDEVTELMKTHTVIVDRPRHAR